VPKNKPLTEAGKKQSHMPIVQADTESGDYYTVRPGDTLWDISRKYGLSITEIKRMNNKRSTTIRPGERLKVSINQLK
jgi:LysM repeat protein